MINIKKYKQLQILIFCTLLLIQLISISTPRSESNPVSSGSNPELSQVITPISHGSGHTSTTESDNTGMGFVLNLKPRNKATVASC